MLAVAVGGWVVVGGASVRGGTAQSGPLADGRAGSGPPSADRGSRDAARVAAAPSLGTLVPAAPAPTPAPTRPRGSTTARPTTVAPTLVPPLAPMTPAPTATGTTTYADEVTRLTNVERAKAGCAALRTDSRLAAAALAHSRDMVDRDYFSHTAPDGDGPGDRAAAAGYPSWSGENIAAGYQTPAEVVQAWMTSSGHRANIVNCQSEATGVGYDPRKNMWTQMFGYV